MQTTMKLAADWYDFAHMGGNATDLELTFAAMIDPRLELVESAPEGNIEHDDREMDELADKVFAFIETVRKPTGDLALLWVGYAYLAWKLDNSRLRDHAQVEAYEGLLTKHWEGLTLAERYRLVVLGFASVEGVPTAHAIYKGRRF